MVLLPHIYWFNKCAQALRNIGPLITTLFALLAWVYNIVEIVIVGGIYALAALIDGLDLSSFQGATFTAFEYLGYANACLPLSESFAALSAFITAWATLIAIRWVKSFIPTVAN